MTNSTSSSRPKTYAHRSRHVAKRRLLLLLRLLRTRPLRQRFTFLALLVLPIVLLCRSILYTHGPVNRISHATEPQGGADGAPALDAADAGVLCLRPAPPVGGVRIAYFVQVANDSLALIPRLLRAMHDPENTYVVHIDAKIPSSKRVALEMQISKLSNVHILPTEMVTYKGVSMVMNTLAAIALALRVNRHWHYFINLSGSDYPLVAPRIQRHLLARPRVPLGRLNFLTLFPRKEWRPYAFRIRYMYWDPAVSGVQRSESRLRVFRGLRENPLEAHRHFTFTKAEAWMILSRPFVRFISRSAYAKRMLLAHLHVRSAPEHYFADVLYNHPLWNKTLVPDAFRKVVWVHRRRRSGQHPYILDRGSHPFAFWLYVKQTRSLFARKFSTPGSPLMDRIDERLSGFVSHPNRSHLVDADEARSSRLAFYANICAHFDDLTKRTLSTQNVMWPEDAYPPPADLATYFNTPA